MKFENIMRKGQVNGTYISVNPDPLYKGADYSLTKAVESLTLNPEGIVGDRHFGFTAITGGRTKKLYERGIQFRNNRQWCGISSDEINKIKCRLGLEKKLTPESLGVNLVIDGLEVDRPGGLSHLAPMTYLVISSDQGDYKGCRPDDVVLVVYAGMLPCKVAGLQLAGEYGNPDFERNFSKAALEMVDTGSNKKILTTYRGSAGWIEKGGIIRPGNVVWALTPKGVD